MLIPAVIALRGITGASWEAQFQLWADDARTTPFLLSGYIVELDIDGGPVLSDGAGLAITPNQGLIVASMTPAQTASLQSETSYRLKLIAPSAGTLDFPVVGKISWVQP